MFYWISEKDWFECKNYKNWKKYLFLIQNIQRLRLKYLILEVFFTTLEYHRLIKICLKNKRSRKVLLVDDALGLGDKNRIIIEKCKPLSIFIACEMHLWSLDLDNKFTLGNSLFGAVRFTKNPDPDKHSYFGYGTRFDRSGSFSLSDGGWHGKNAVRFGVIVIFLCMKIR